MKQTTKRNGNLFGAIAYSVATIASLGNVAVSVKQKDREELALSGIAALATGVLAYICVVDFKHNSEEKQ